MVYGSLPEKSLLIAFLRSKFAKFAVSPRDADVRMRPPLNEGCPPLGSDLKSISSTRLPSAHKVRILLVWYAVSSWPYHSRLSSLVVDEPLSARLRTIEIP